jgi:hypothetical protein
MSIFRRHMKIGPGEILSYGKALIQFKYETVLIIVPFNTGNAPYGAPLINTVTTFFGTG